jgi:hypothetical protein
MYQLQKLFIVGDDYGFCRGKDFKCSSLRTQEKSLLRFESLTLIND